MRVPNGVLAAIGLRSPLTSAKPTTSDDATIFVNWFGHTYRQILEI